jgi:hypothetical protein
MLLLPSIESLEENACFFLSFANMCSEDVPREDAGETGLLSDAILSKAACIGETCSILPMY